VERKPISLQIKLSNIEIPTRICLSISEHLPADSNACSASSFIRNNHQESIICRVRNFFLALLLILFANFHVPPSLKRQLRLIYLINTSTDRSAEPITTEPQRINGPIHFHFITANNSKVKIASSKHFCFSLTKILLVVA